MKEKIQKFAARHKIDITPKSVLEEEKKQQMTMAIKKEVPKPQVPGPGPPSFKPRHYDHFIR
jgi:hypothetical protein